VYKHISRKSGGAPETDLTSSNPNQEAHYSIHIMIKALYNDNEECKHAHALNEAHSNPFLGHVFVCGYRLHAIVLGL